MRAQPGECLVSARATACAEQRKMPRSANPDRDGGRSYRRHGWLFQADRIAIRGVGRKSAFSDANVCSGSIAPLTGCFPRCGRRTAVSRSRPVKGNGDLTRAADQICGTTDYLVGVTDRIAESSRLAALSTLSSLPSCSPADIREDLTSPFRVSQQASFSGGMVASADCREG